MQNSVLGVVLATQHFGNPLTAVPCAVSSVCHSIFGSALVGIWRRSVPDQVQQWVTLLVYLDHESKIVAFFFDTASQSDTSSSVVIGVIGSFLEVPSVDVWLISNDIRYQKHFYFFWWWFQGVPGNFWILGTSKTASVRKIDQLCGLAFMVLFFLFFIFYQGKIFVFWTFMFF